MQLICPGELEIHTEKNSKSNKSEQTKKHNLKMYMKK